MANTLLMPKLGLTMEEGTLSMWHKKEGETVKQGEPLFDIETNKLVNTIEAEREGVLTRILVPEGETVPCLTPIGIIAAEGENPEASEAPRNAETAPKDRKKAGIGEVVVIGGGPGGYVAALRAGSLGANVTLIEKDKIGGTCLNRGCMPTKALLHSAETLNQIRNSEDFGIIANGIDFDWAKVQERRAFIVEKLTSGVAALLRAGKIKLKTGEASFLSKNELRVGDEIINAEKIILAVGGVPIMPPIDGLKESENILDSTAALCLDHVPEKLLIVGGGVIGLEMGLVYRSFGSEVTIVELTPRLLPGMDSELTGILQKQLESDGIVFYLNSRLASVKDRGGKTLCRIESPEGKFELEASKVLVAAGRKPKLDALAPDKAGIKLENGFIKVDEHLKSSVDGIYAIGDCAHPLMLAHAAMIMGEIAAANITGGNEIFYPQRCPNCVYIGPEFASIGYGEEELKEKGTDFETSRFPMYANGKSLVTNDTEGFIKIFSDKKFGELLGVHALCARATDIIETAALAIQLEVTKKEFSELICCHPSVSEALREAALRLDKKAIHIPNK